MSDFLVKANVANLYKEARSSSEVVSQTILGALVQGEDDGSEFVFVQTEDRYQGWLQRAHLIPNWDRTDFLRTSVATLFADVYDRPDSHSELITKLVTSTPVSLAHKPQIDDFIPLVLPDQQIGYVHKVCLNITHSSSASEAGQFTPDTMRALDISDLKRRVLSAVGEQAAQAAKRLVGTPYLWGGCTPFGIDCSGLVQLAFKLSGLQLLRDADLQFHDRRFGRIFEEESFSEADFQAGDLVVFGNHDTGKATHIGIALGDGRFVHSRGGYGVRIDPCIDDSYAANYLGCVRVSTDADLAIEAA